MRTTTVQQLIDQLEYNHRPDESIVFQYMVASFVGMDEDVFRPVAEYIMDNESFGEESIQLFDAWITEGKDVLETLAEQEN